MRKTLVLLFALLSLALTGCAGEFENDDYEDPSDTPQEEAPNEDDTDEENGENGENDETDENDGVQVPDVERGERYTTPEEVAYYLHLFDELPPNYITKDEAEAKGWVPSEGNLWDVTDQKLIGGDRFYNREGRLPSASGRIFFEADVNYEGGYRGAERLVYSNDGLIYYTDDHYDTFTLKYGDE